MIVKSYSKEYFGNLASWILTLSCFGYPISAILSLILNINSTLFNGFFRAIIFALSIYVLFFFSSIHKTNNRSNQSKILLFFLFLYSFKVVWDKTIGNVSTEHSNSYIFLFLFGGVLFPVLAITLTLKFTNFRKLILKIFHFLCIGNLMLLLYFLFQNEWQFNIAMLLTRAEIRGVAENSFVVNPISYGFYGASLFIVSISILMLYLNEINFKKNYTFYFFYF